MYPLRERILIVDHDPVMTRLIGNVLQRHHYQVAGTAGSGKEALAQVVETEPDLAMVELGLGGSIDGVNTARYLRTILDLPVILHTPATDTATISRARQAHPAGILPIPFNDRQICTAIDVAIFQHSKLLSGGALYPSRELADWRGNGAALTDVKGTVWFLNQVGKELLGLGREAVRRQPFDELSTFLDPVGKEQIQDLIAGALNGGPYPLVKNVCIVQKGGEERYLGLVAHQLRNLESQLQGVISFLRPL